MSAFFIYLVCFGVGLLFTLLSAAMSHVFGGHDVHVDVNAHAEAGFGTDDMPGFSALSPTTIATFVTAFGGFGMIFDKIEATHNPLISAPLSVLVGFVIAAALVSLLRTVFNRTQSSSESKVSQLPGISATIITPIPLNGVGEIAYIHGGTRYTAPAREEKGAAIENGKTVTITRIVGSQFYVTAA